MRLHYLQHVPFEDAANIACWAAERGHSVSRTLLYADRPLPPHHAYDWLVIMGGPMNIYQHDRHPWLAREKEFIQTAIQQGKTVLGVCLGAQLIADVLGGRVVKNDVKEIGWFPVRITREAADSPLFRDMPREFTAFHWHGDTFALPPGATHCAASEACANQAFEFGGRIVGLQFHLDYSATTIERMIEHCADELQTGPFIQQDPAALLAPLRVAEIKKLLYGFLDQLATGGTLKAAG